MDKFKDYPDELHPFKNYVMKGVKTPETHVTEAEALNLDNLPVEELKRLLRLCSPSSVEIAMLTPDQQADRMLHKLASLALTSEAASIRDCIAAITLWLDRVKGKAPTIQVNNSVNNGLTVNIVRFSDKSVNELIPHIVDHDANG
jgi:hypothetical protein